MEIEELLKQVAEPVTAEQIISDQPKPTEETKINETTPLPQPEKPEQSEQPEQPEAKFEEIPAQPVTAEQLVTDPIPAKRGRGRPPGTKNKPKEGESIIAEPGATPVEEVPQTNYALLSEMIFDTSANALSVAFGPEWQPQNPNERGHVCSSLASYLKSKEVKDIPPGMMLTIVLCAYSAPRLKAPTTSGKIKMGWLWLKSKFSRKKKQQLTVLP